MRPIIELKTIQYMLAIEREGCFQKASDALHISQPALSQYIKRIENELGFLLYERGRGRCVPTKAGKVLLDRGKVLLESYNAIMDEMKAASDLRDVSTGWPTGYTTRCLNGLLSYMNTHALVNVHVLEDTVETLTSLLLRGDMDLIFVPVIYAHPNIDYVTVQHEEFYLSVPKNHPANDIVVKHQEDGFIDLYHLRDMPFVSVEAKAYREFVYPLFREFGGEPNVIFVCKDWEHSLALSAQGSCLTILPYWYAENDHEQLNFYRIKSKQKNYRIFAYATRKNATITHEMQAVIDYMMTSYGDAHAGTLVNQEKLEWMFRA